MKRVKICSEIPPTHACIHPSSHRCRHPIRRRGSLSGLTCRSRKIRIWYTGEFFLRTRQQKQETRLAVPRETSRLCPFADTGNPLQFPYAEYWPLPSCMTLQPFTSIHMCYHSCDYRYRLHATDASSCTEWVARTSKEVHKDPGVLLPMHLPLIQMKCHLPQRKWK